LDGEEVVASAVRRGMQTTLIRSDSYRRESGAGACANSVGSCRCWAGNSVADIVHVAVGNAGRFAAKT
jgi:hypothetical protein